MISLYTLIFSNLIPFLGVLFFDWNSSEIIFLYWFETGVIGGYNVLKMALAKNLLASGNIHIILKIGLIIFFVFHFGGFCVTQGMFVAGLMLNGLPYDSAFFTSMGVIFLSHGVSFGVNYIGKKEYEKASLIKLMFAPYIRVGIMGITVIFSMFLIFISSESVILLLVLILLKTLADMAGHLFEHKGNVYILVPWGEKILKPVMPNIEELAEKSYRQSVATGQFNEMAKKIDPEMVKYIKKFYSTPKELRSQLKPPENYSNHQPKQGF